MENYDRAKPFSPQPTMSTVQITIPEEVLISLKQTPDNLSRELCRLA